MFNSLRNFFWNIDPGYFNLKLAAKTVLAIMVSLWIVRDGVLSTQMMAGIGSGIAMQGIIAQTFRQRALHIVIFSFSYIAVFALGLLVRDSPEWTALTLVGLGFLVNYIRRFDLEKSVAPLMVWILCFMATILPFNNTMDAWTHIYGLFIGLGVAAVVIMAVFPENYHKLFINNCNYFFEVLHLGMDEMQRNMPGPDRYVKFDDLNFVQRLQTLTKIADSSHAMLHQHDFAGKDPRSSEIIVYQYALINAYSLLIDAYSYLWQHHIILPPATQLALSRMCMQLSRLFSSMHLEKNLTISKKDDYNSSTAHKERIGAVPAAEPGTIIMLLNFKLGFELLGKNIKKQDAAIK